MGRQPARVRRAAAGAVIQRGNKPGGEASKKADKDNSRNAASNSSSSSSSSTNSGHANADSARDSRKSPQELMGEVYDSLVKEATDKARAAAKQHHLEASPDEVVKMFVQQIELLMWEKSLAEGTNLGVLPAVVRESA